MIVTERSSSPDEVRDEVRAWDLLSALARRASTGPAIVGDTGLRLDAQGQLEAIAATDNNAWLVARPSSARGWSPASGPSRLATTVAAEMLLDLHMPLCVGEGSQFLVLGHLAQSLDGRIATVSGHSQFITANENLVHAHRLRALSDVVLVGRRTVEEDDPRLTTRLVEGRNPLRAVVDPDRRLRTDHQLFRDGLSPTLLFCTPRAAQGDTHHGQAELATIEPVDGRLPVAAILAELRRRGLHRVYIEGGGMTVSRFVEAGVLSRLQITVAPTVLGSGRSMLTLPEIAHLSEALPLECRHFAMGRDMLFDCTFVR